MADPLSVSASVVGLIGAGAKISQALAHVVSKARHAPKECKNLRIEVDTIQAILSQLQLFLLGNRRAPRSRTSLILVDQVIATLAACVTTFSELDIFTEALQSDHDLGILDRLRWVAKEGEVKDLLTRLESHKSSLNLMLMILTCQKQEEAEDKVDILCELVQKVLESNEILNQRLAAMEAAPLALQPKVTEVSSDPLRSSLDEVSKFAVEDVGAGITRTGTWSRDKRGFAFEELLLSSRAYRNASRDNTDAFSIISSAGRTGSWSMLSGLSLSETSHIGILAIPIYETDIANKEAYDFNPPAVEPVAVIVQTEPASRVSKNSRREWLKGLVRGDTQRQRQSENAQTEPEPLQPKRVFGAPLAESIQYANVAISLTNSQGETFVWGYIPIVVAKVGVLLKEKASDVDDIFAHPGNPSRLMHMQTVFDTPERYGRGLNWDGYTVHDAAAILLRFVKTLPQPVIPYDMHDSYIKTCEVLAAAHDISALSGDGEDFEKVRVETQQLIRALPPSNRQLLIYLLDLIKVFGGSRTNKMTVARLTAAFQPAILSKPPAEMDAEAYAVAGRVVIFLTDFHEDFLYGILDEDDKAATGDEA
ncbi:Rho GTPase activation protein [Xylariaceae sp. FL1272]|nr:Rho GTPase activation protein [Xylariaceae sp. FL1272]